MTLAAVSPPGRFGAINLSEGPRKSPASGKSPAGTATGSTAASSWLRPRPRLHRGRRHRLGKEPMRSWRRKGKLSAYRHEGFWQAMDTLRDKDYLEELWAKGNAPWKNWELAFGRRIACAI